MRILLIAPYIPSLIRVRPYNFIRVLSARGHDVTLLALQPPGEPTDSLPQLGEWCTNVLVIPHDRQRILLNELKAFVSNRPLQAAYSESPALVQVSKELLAGTTFDVAHVEHLRGAPLTSELGALPVVFDSVDSISLLFGKVLKSAPSLKSRIMAQVDLGRTQRFEGQLTERFNHVAVTSAIDAQSLVDLGCDSERVTVVPNGVDLEYFQPQLTERDPRRLVFTGKMSYHANVAAAKDLAEQVMPLVWARQPDVQLQIVGKDPSPAVRALAAHPNVTVTGSVPDLRPYLAQASLAVSTMRYGVGIQNKVLEAMAMGTPVVASPHAISTLKVEDGRELLVGKTPEAIAQHILDLLTSPERAQALGAAGRHYVEAHQSWETAVSLLEEVYAKTLVQRLETGVTAWARA
jgi:polysaccharide biosynthesis protein PslH